MVPETGGEPDPPHDPSAHPHARRPAASGSSSKKPFRRVRRRWRRLSRYERRRRIITASILVAVVVVVGLALAALSAWRAVSAAETSLNQARSTVKTLVGVRSQLLTHQGRQEAALELSTVETLAQQASSDLHGSLGLDVLGFLPYLHSQRAGVIDLAQDVEQTASDGSTLLTTVETLVVRSHGTAVALSDLATLRQQLATVVARQAVMNRSSGGLVSPLASARRKFDSVDSRLTSLLEQGQQLVGYALPFLGADGPRTYLLAAENNAEMRDQGAVLSYALMTTANGTYSVGQQGPIGDIALRHPAAFPIPPGTEAVFGGYAPTFLWQSTNATADFTWSGADMQAMFLQATGIKVDGVIGVDVPMLVRLLRLTGPVKVPGIPLPVDAADATTLLLHDLYEGALPGVETARNDQLAAVFKAVVGRLKTGHIDLASLAEALAQGVAARDLVAWDANPAYQATITRFHGSGAIDTVNPTRTFHVAVENGTATKLDYYVHEDIVMHVAVTAGNHAVVDTAVTVHNAAPAGQKASYQLGPDGVSSTVPGQYVAHVYLWSPRGSDVEGGTPESGLIVEERDVSVLAQHSETVQFQTVLSDAVQSGQLHLEFMPQPRLSAPRLTVSVSAPSWLLDTRATITTPLAKQLQLSWGLVRP